MVFINSVNLNVVLTRNRKKLDKQGPPSLHLLDGVGVSLRQVGDGPRLAVLPSVGLLPLARLLKKVRIKVYISVSVVLP